MYIDIDCDWLKILFGYELKIGNVMYLDIKEGVEFGVGLYGMFIGIMGFGKFEFLCILILLLVVMIYLD